MSKQILIDYDEYLKLEKFKKLVDDIREEVLYRPTYLHNRESNSVVLGLEMPDSFKNLLDELNASYTSELSKVEFKIWGGRKWEVKK